MLVGEEVGIDEDGEAATGSCKKEATGKVRHQTAGGGGVSQQDKKGRPFFQKVWLGRRATKQMMRWGRRKPHSRVFFTPGSFHK